MLRLILALQSVGVTGVPTDFDLRKVAQTPDPGSIVVTARKQSQRVERSAPPSQEPPLGRAEMGLFGKAKANLHVDSESFANGTTSQRVMVGIKLPF